MPVRIMKNLMCPIKQNRCFQGMIIDHSTTKCERASCIERCQRVAEESVFKMKYAFVKVLFLVY